MRGERVFLIEREVHRKILSHSLYILQHTFRKKSNLFAYSAQRGSTRHFSANPQGQQQADAKPACTPRNFCHAFVSVKKGQIEPRRWGNTPLTEGSISAPMRNRRRSISSPWIAGVFRSLCVILSFSLYILYYIFQKKSSVSLLLPMQQVLRVFWDPFVTLSARQRGFLIPSLIFSINIIPYFSRKVKSFLVTPRAEIRSAREGVERKSAG